MEHILLGKKYRYRIAKDEKGLTLACAAGEEIVSRAVLTARPCRLFSADADEKDVLHIACVTDDTLTYLRHAGGKTSTTHLMRLPDGFSVTGIDVLASENVKLYYCVKSREGNAVICYTLTGDAWQGANLLTSADEIRLLCAGKERADCLIEVRGEGGLSLQWAQERGFSVFAPVTCAQVCGNEAIYCSGGHVFRGEKLLVAGDAVYVLDRERLLVRQGDALRRVSAAGRVIGPETIPRGARETVVCEPGREKRLCLSPPFPLLQKKREDPDNALTREVYMQQRTLFSLQGEVRELKQRLRRLEEERKR